MKKIVTLLAIALFVVQCTPKRHQYSQGVSKELAQRRKTQIADLSYKLNLTIPKSIDSLCSGSVNISCKLLHKNHPLVIDFRAPEDHILSIQANTKRAPLYSIKNGHIQLPVNQFRDSSVSVTIKFKATNTGLNRNKEYLYTLFVPDRASTAFPCFDQPDLKATYHLQLTTPKNWKAVSNGSLLNKKQKTQTTAYTFEPTAPISTYLFSFVAGKFNILTQQKGERTLRLFHREEDSTRIRLNRDKIFKLQFEALTWMENYTHFEHPFSKLDMIAIPSFQYSGMEHPGAILYRAEKLFLPAEASVQQEMDRANLISHETAHLWFGDLVTMKWFNEVWLKEVFANFLADMIVEEAYPHIDHQLNFYLNHFEEAFSVDRTEGATPIQQPLGNLLDAGSLYGPIIYHKSPIVMKQLEELVTPEALHKGLQNYISKYAYNNASWHDLISLLNQNYDGDLLNWSNTWLNFPGRPNITILPAFNADKNLASLIIKNQHPHDTVNIWQQPLSVYVKAANKKETIEFLVLDTLQAQTLSTPIASPKHLIPGSKGLGYAHFSLATPYQRALFTQFHTFEQPLHRAIAYQIAWEHMLEHTITPQFTAKNYLRALQMETNQQLREWLMQHLKTLFVEWLPRSQAPKLCDRFNSYLWQQMQIPDLQNKLAFFNTYLVTAYLAEDLQRLKQMLNNELRIPNFSLASREQISLGLALMLKDPANYSTTKKSVLEKLDEEELKEKFLLLSQAASPVKATRDSLFYSFKEPSNREKETWVVEAIHYLHHPAHAHKSIEYILPSLELLTEIQRTGDIFFPKQWLNATFWSHSEPEVLEIVHTFLNNHPDFPQHLRNKVLQAIDDTKRKAQQKTESTIEVQDKL